MADVEDPVTPPQLQPCSICSRTFLPESLGKHYKTCEKNASKKRKIFDSTKQRVQGTDLAAFLPVILKTKKVEKEKTPARKQGSSKWKEQHLEFVRAIRAARGVNDGDQEPSMGAITRSSNHEQCPTCERNFGPKAYDRHIEWCREKHARLPCKSNASTEAVMAKERLEARTKYRAPPLNKSRREVTREKYSTSRSGAGDSKRVSVEKLTNMSPVNHTHSQASPHLPSPKETSSAPQFQRTPHRSSYRQRSASPVKRPSIPVVSTVASERREAATQLRPRGVSPQKVRRDVRESPQKLARSVRDPPAQKQGRNANDLEMAAEPRNKQRAAPPPPKKNDNMRNRKMEESLTNSEEDRGIATAVEDKSRKAIHNSQRQVMKTLPMKELHAKPAFTPSKISYDNSIYKQAIGDKSPVRYRNRVRHTSGEFKSLSLRKPMATVAARRSNVQVLPMNQVNVSEGSFENNSRPFNEKLRGTRRARAGNAEWEKNSSSKDDTPRLATPINTGEKSSAVASLGAVTRTDGALSEERTDAICSAGSRKRNEGKAYFDYSGDPNGDQVLQRTYSGRSDGSGVNMKLRRPSSGQSYRSVVDTNLGGTYSVCSSVGTDMGQTSSGCADGLSTTCMNMGPSNCLRSPVYLVREPKYYGLSSILDGEADIRQTYSDAGGRSSDTKQTYSAFSGGYTEDSEIGQTYSGHSDRLNLEMNMQQTYSICSDRPAGDNNNTEQTFSDETLNTPIDMSLTYTVNESTVSERHTSSDTSGNHLKTLNSHAELCLADLTANPQPDGVEGAENTVKQSDLLLDLSCKSVSNVDFTSPISFRSSSMTSTPLRRKNSCDFQDNGDICGDAQDGELNSIVDQLKLTYCSRNVVVHSSRSTRDVQSRRSNSNSSREAATKYTLTNRSTATTDALDTCENTPRNCDTEVALPIDSKVALQIDSEIRPRTVPEKVCGSNSKWRRVCKLEASHSCDGEDGISPPGCSEVVPSGFSIDLGLELDLDQLSNRDSLEDSQQGQSVQQDSGQNQEDPEHSYKMSYLKSDRDGVNNGSKDLSFDNDSLFKEDSADSHIEDAGNDSPRSFLSACESYYKPKEPCVDSRPLASDLETRQMSPSTSDDGQSDDSLCENRQVYQPVLRYWGSDFRLSFEENKSYALSKLKAAEQSRKRKCMKSKKCHVEEGNNILSISEETPDHNEENSAEYLVTVWSNQNLTSSSKHANHNMMTDYSLREAVKCINNKVDRGEQIPELQQELSQVKKDLLQKDLKVEPCTSTVKRKIREPKCLVKKVTVVQEKVETFKIVNGYTDNLSPIQSETYLWEEQGQGIKMINSAKLRNVLPDLPIQSKNVQPKQIESKNDVYPAKIDLPLIQLQEITRTVRNVDIKLKQLKKSQQIDSETSFWSDQADVIKSKDTASKDASKFKHSNISKAKELESNFWAKQADLIKLNDSTYNNVDLKSKHSKKLLPEGSNSSFWAQQAEVIKLNESISKKDNSRPNQSKKLKRKQLEANFWSEQAENIKLNESTSKKDAVKIKHKMQSNPKEQEPNFWAKQAEVIGLNGSIIKNDDLKFKCAESNFREEQEQAVQVQEDERHIDRYWDEYQNPNMIGTKLTSPLPLPIRKQATVPKPSQLQSANKQPPSQSLGLQSDGFTHRALYVDDDSEDERAVVVTKMRADGGRRPRNGRSSPEAPANNRRMINRNTDSAYSSLNRKSPLLSIHTIVNRSDLADSARVMAERTQLSSSGSEPELPRMSSLKMSHDLRSPMGTEVSTPTPTNQMGLHQQEHSTQKSMTKFCYECGYKFPLQLAKFCCECGAKRLVV